MKRLLTLLLCLLLSCAAAEELDEETLAQMEFDGSAPISAPAPEDGVYAASDAEDAEEDVPFEQRIDPGPLPEYVSWLLAVAQNELGYMEGPNNYSKYGKWSGDANAAWCAEFVCWCVDQVDQQHGTSLLETVYPNYSGQNTGRDWFLKHGRFVYRKGVCPDWGSQWLKDADHNLEKNEYIPRPGDLVFFSYNDAGDTEHVALVEYCAYDSQGEVIIHVIEGNNPSMVQRNRYRLSHSQVLGFGMPEDRIDTTIRYGNRSQKVLELQQSLHLIGMLEERHLTGTCGANTKQALIRFQTECMEGKTPTGIADRETQQAIADRVYELIYNSPDTWLVEEQE